MKTGKDRKQQRFARVKSILLKYLLQAQEEVYQAHIIMWKSCFPSKNKRKRMKKAVGETGKGTMTIMGWGGPRNRHIRYLERRGLSQDTTR